MNLFNLFKRQSTPQEQTVNDNAVSEPEEISSITSGVPAFEWLTGGASGYGKAVSETTAMSQTTVYSCVNLIGGAVSSIPLHLYRSNEDGRERIKSDIWQMFNQQLSTRFSAAVGWEFGLQSLLLRGDLFFRIDRASMYSNRIVGFTPMHPDAVNVYKHDNRLVYAYNDDGIIKSYDQDDVIHVPGPGFDGKRGMSQIQYVLRQPLNVANDAAEQSGAFLGGGMRPDVVVKMPNHVKMDNNQIDQLRMNWTNRYVGIQKGRAPVVLTNGAEIQQLTMTSVDAQLLETRKLQSNEIAQIFGVPPHLLGMTEKSTSWGSGIEQMSIGFVKYTLSRHLVKIEQEINRKCFSQKSPLFFEFDTKGLERGDIKSRNESYRIALGRAGEPGWMTTNEIRRAENLPPIEGGDVLFNIEAKNETKPNPTTTDQQ